MFDFQEYVFDKFLFNIRVWLIYEIEIKFGCKKIFFYLFFGNESL